MTIAHKYAQTNLQLYEQMRHQGYDLEDITRMKQGYDLAIKLFSGQYRANGKPFLNHLVGTASILLSRNLPVHLAITGLLHASYSHGKLAFPGINLRSVKRRELQKVIGREIEGLICEYTKFRLTPAIVRRLTEYPQSLGAIQRSVILVRLANDLEDHLDNGLAYCGKHKSIYTHADSAGNMSSLTSFLDQAELYAEILRIRCAIDSEAIPDALRNSQSSSFEVPASPVRWLRRRLKSLLAHNG
jgi:hypothetical protein